MRVRVLAKRERVRRTFKHTAVKWFETVRRRHKTTSNRIGLSVWYGVVWNREKVDDEWTSWGWMKWMDRNEKSKTNGKNEKRRRRRIIHINHLENVSFSYSRSLVISIHRNEKWTVCGVAGWPKKPTQTTHNQSDLCSNLFYIIIRLKGHSTLATCMRSMRAASALFFHRMTNVSRKHFLRGVERLCAVCIATDDQRRTFSILFLLFCSSSHSDANTVTSKLSTNCRWWHRHGVCVCVCVRRARWKISYQNVNINVMASEWLHSANQVVAMKIYSESVSAFSPSHPPRNIAQMRQTTEWPDRQS